MRDLGAGSGAVDTDRNIDDLCLFHLDVWRVAEAASWGRFAGLPLLKRARGWLFEEKRDLEDKRGDRWESFAARDRDAACRRGIMIVRRWGRTDRVERSFASEQVAVTECQDQNPPPAPSVVCGER
jgi:hypothetical protein